MKFRQLQYICLYMEIDNYIVNLTFFMLPGREEKVLAWLRSRVAGFIAAGIGADHALSKVCELGAGETPDNDEEPISVAYQVKFATLDEARRWRDNEVAALSLEYESNFGPDAMTFVSIFSSLPIV